MVRGRDNGLGREYSLGKENIHLTEVRYSKQSKYEQEEGENEDEHHEDKDELDGDKEDVTEQDTEEKNEEDIRGQLMRSLTNKLNGKSYNLISYIAQDKQNLSQLLLQEASDISRLERASSADMELWKLAVSSTINLMHPSFEARLFNLFTEKQLDKMKYHMSDQKKAFESIATPEMIDSLFDSMLIYQMDLNTDRVIDFIDGEKYKEKDKHSERYKLLKLIWIVINNFDRLKADNATETLFSANFELLLTIMFEGDNISIESGETVSEATSRAAAANNYSTSDFGRRIDILIHNSCYKSRNEYCCIDFKRQDAAMGLLTMQQSKNISLNGAILNDLRAKASADDMFIIYMDFWGADGYIVGLTLFENVHLADQISSVHMPVSLIELEDFRSTLKYMYKWRQNILHQSRKVALGVFKEKRKYETVDISRSSIFACLSPERITSEEPLYMYYSPKHDADLDDQNGVETIADALPMTGASTYWSRIRVVPLPSIHQVYTICADNDTTLAKFSHATERLLGPWRCGSSRWDYHDVLCPLCRKSVCRFSKISAFEL
ncbi:hypothetical protein [Parasitella parasitica]|uniref:Uncharacterized protein n=1 Tax=Parasitella parasitica TaxID=35722 RepID=A0A0B7NHH8_9FUNG|nr:hypothetical protein [Parasitella parasitica]